MRAEPVRFQLLDFDDIGEEAGTFIHALTGDASDYRVTYTLTVP